MIKIIIEKDGNEWICYDENFVNLQESDNYAFGENPIEALKKYMVLNK